MFDRFGEFWRVFGQFLTVLTMFDSFTVLDSFGQFYIWDSLDSNIVLQCGYCEQFGKLFSFTVWKVLDSFGQFWTVLYLGQFRQ